MVAQSFACFSTMLLPLAIDCLYAQRIQKYFVFCCSSCISVLAPEGRLPKDHSCTQQLVYFQGNTRGIKAHSEISRKILEALLIADVANRHNLFETRNKTQYSGTVSTWNHVKTKTKRSQLPTTGKALTWFYCDILNILYSVKICNLHWNNLLICETFVDLFLLQTNPAIQCM